MNSKIVFGKWESIALLIDLMCTQIFLVFPRLMAEMAGSAAWLLVLYISVLALIAFLILARLYRNFEGKDLLDLGDYVAGGAGRTVVGVILLGYLIFAISLILREFSEDLKVISLKMSPISFVMLFFLIGMLAGAAFGIEAIVRLCIVAVPIIMVGFLFLVLAVSQFYDLNNLFPILGQGPKAIFIDGTSRISSFSAITVVFLIAPFFPDSREF